MSALHTGEIECLARRICLSPIHWLGVFARDQLPDLKQVPRPFALIVNTDPHDLPGQHWLAIYGPRDGPVELFDSFGMSADVYGFPMSFKHSQTRFQSFSSVLCGHYTLYFLYNRSQISFNKIISVLSTFSSPDKYVDNFVHALQLQFRTQYPCTRTGQCCTMFDKCSFC